MKCALKEGEILAQTKFGSQFVLDYNCYKETRNQACEVRCKNDKGY